MYGTTGASDYTSTHANTNKSTMLTNLETWYTNNLTLYENKIADTVWCNDKTIITDTTYNPSNYSKPTGLGYGTNYTIYSTTQRLVSTTNNAGGTGPSLKCNGELSKITTKIGLLTADELAFAGYALNISNTTTYLQENATDDLWWSLSPGVFDGGYANVWCVNGEDGLDYGYVDNDFAIRPSISLKSSVTATGDGTSENPYVIVS